MDLQLINGIFYAEFKLSGIDNELAIKEITNTYLNGDSSIKEGYRPQGKLEEIDPRHTYYEDVPISLELTKQMVFAIKSVYDGVFGKDNCEMESIWGHFTPPLEQTMVHDHNDNSAIPNLSFVYYPHFPDNSGIIHFISNVDGCQTHTQPDVKLGHLYLFSSQTLHYVPRNASTENRISISGNIAASTKFEELLSKDYNFTNNYWYFIGKNDKYLKD